MTKEAESALGSPQFLAVLLLRCPYCNIESLREGKSWFEFKALCPRCHYKIERENGYFTGASWMINFPVTATLAFSLVVWLFKMGTLGSMGIAGVAAFFTFAFGLWFFPYSQSLWLYFEHRLRPLEADDFVVNP